MGATCSSLSFVSISFVAQLFLFGKSVNILGRNEPQHLIQVLEVLAKVRGESIQELADAVYQNTLRVFFPKEL